MTRLVEVSNSNSNSNNNRINYRNKKAYDKRLLEKAMEARMKIDFAKGIKTLNVAKVEAALRRGYRPTPQTQNRAYNDLRRHHATGNTPSTKKAIAMFIVLVKYKLEPYGPLGFVDQYLTEDIRQLPTPVLRKMVSTWRIFETEDDLDLSNMLYMTIGERTVEISKLANVKMLLDMFKTHGKRPVVVDGVRIKAFSKKKVKFLLANLPRIVLKYNVDFSGSLAEISRKQVRIQYLRTLNDRGIDLGQVILETKTPEELGFILEYIYNGNEYAKSGVLYKYVSTGNPKMTKFLLQRGMDPNSSRRDLDDILAGYVGDRGERLSPLRIAIERRNIKDLRLFKKKGIVVTPELRRYLERYMNNDNPIYKLLIPPTRPPRMRKVTLVNSFNTVDPVSLTPVPLNQAMIYHGNTRLANTPNTQKEKVRWVFHPNTINGMRHSTMHPMTRLPLNHSKATKLMPLLRKSDQRRYMTKWARDVAANQ